MIISEMVIVAWKPHIVAPLVGTIHFLFLRQMTCKESIYRESTSDSFDNQMIEFWLCIKEQILWLFCDWFSFSSMIINKIWLFFGFWIWFSNPSPETEQFHDSFLSSIEDDVLIHLVQRLIIFIGESPFFCPAEQVYHVLT